MPFWRGAALTVLQLGAGLLLGYTPSNPLLATFAIFVGLLLWFKLSGIIMLVAAAWIAVASHDKDIPILLPTEAERIAAEHQALLLAAQVRLRTANEAREAAPWYRAWRADFDVREAEDELERVEASAPAAAITSTSKQAARQSKRAAKQAERAQQAQQAKDSGGKHAAAADKVETHAEHVRSDR